MGVKDNLCDVCGKKMDNKLDMPRMIEGKFMCKPCFDKMMAAEKAEANKAQSALDNQKNNILMSTTSTIDGYRTIENCGLVFGETVFKHSFLSSLSAGFNNIIDFFSFQSTEMSGSMELIETARQYAYGKMVDQAIAKGANAIVGIDSDNTIGGDIMYISLYGTAVKVEKENNN